MNCGNKPLNSHEEDAKLLEQLASSGVETRLTRYQNWIAEMIRENHSDALFQEVLLPIIEEERPYVGSVAISVVMRTQGRRPDALREALLCLYSQSSRNFELLLVAHKPNEDQLAVVEEILDELEPEFRKQIRFFVLDYGQRSMPLNIGFAHARGEYIAVLDDDDLVLEDWVLDFEKAAKEHPGKMLHAYCFSQQWKTVLDTGEQQALQAAAAPMPTYCEDFVLSRQLIDNWCPLISLGFPRTAFADYGIIFDDSLTTAEDWDCFMRTAILFGINDIDDPTSIYRLWVNAENSHTLHSEQEWKNNRKKILNKTISSFVLFEPDDVTCMIAPHMPDHDSETQSASATQMVVYDDSPTLPEVLNSASWKIGRLITFIPRKLYSFFREIKKAGFRHALWTAANTFKSLPKLFATFFR